MAPLSRSLLFRWPGMLLAGLAGLACLVAVGHTLVRIIQVGEHAAPDPEAQQRSFRRTEALDARAAELGIEAVLELEEGAISARVFFEPELLPDSLELTLRRADAASAPLVLRLARRNAEAFGAPLTALADGVWLAELAAPDWRLKARLDVPRFAMVHISPVTQARSNAD